MTSPRALSGKQLRHLRALGHELKPVVQLGKNGWNSSLSAEIDQALEAHELIKLRLNKEAPLDPSELRSHVEKELGATPVQTIGHVVLIYRGHPKTPKIQLPR